MIFRFWVIYSTIKITICIKKSNGFYLLSASLFFDNRLAGKKQTFKQHDYMRYRGILKCEGYLQKENKSLYQALDKERAAHLPPLFNDCTVVKNRTVTINEKLMRRRLSFNYANGAGGGIVLFYIVHWLPTTGFWKTMTLYMRRCVTVDCLNSHNTNSFMLLTSIK